MFKRIPDRIKSKICSGDPLTVLCHHLWLPLRPLALPLSRVVQQPVQDGGGPRRYGGGAAGRARLVGAGLEGVGAEPGRKGHGMALLLFILLLPFNYWC